MPNYLVGKKPMPQKPYLYRQFPAYRYKKDCRPAIVHNQADDEKLLADGWRKTPKEQVIDLLPDNLKDNAEKIGTVIENVAGVTNMLLRVPKSRRKKDLYVVGDMLGLDLDNSGYSLKKLKSVILEEAKEQGHLQEYFDAQEQENEHSHTSH
jgi:hypothetical protein